MSVRENPFEVLGVASDTDDRSLRQRYAAVLREARAAGDPERVQAVQQAFEAIRDEESRARLRRQLETAHRVEPLLERASAAIEAGDHGEAADLLRQAVLADPESEVVHFALFQHQASLGLERVALESLEKLAVLAPENSNYLLLGAEYRLRVSDWLDGETRRGALAEALHGVKRARRLGADGTRVTVLEARILRALGSCGAAITLLRKSWDAANELRSSELSIGLELLRMHGERGEEVWFSEVLGRVAQAFAGEQQRSETVADELCSLAEELAAFSVPAAIECAEVARCLAPRAEPVANFANWLRQRRRELAEALAAAPEASTPPRVERAFERRWVRVGLFCVLFVIIAALALWQGSVRNAERAAEKARDQLKMKLRNETLRKDPRHAETLERLDRMKKEAEERR